jgi:hypothetical protein
MQIHCINGTPIVDTLNHLPPLPLLVDYWDPLTEKDELGLYHALQLHDRVRHINLHLLPSILHKSLVLMDKHFPILEHLSLVVWANKFNTLTLPKTFLAPNLRHIILHGIYPPQKIMVPYLHCLPRCTHTLEHPSLVAMFAPGYW